MTMFQTITDLQSYIYLLGEPNQATRSWTIAIGLAAFAGGVLLMVRHKREIDEYHRLKTDPHELEFQQRKFRRRTLASTLFAAMGILMTSLYWARDPYAGATLVSLVLLLLLAVMFLASLDIMSVGLHSVTVDDHQARQEMVDEYVRQRKLLMQKTEEESSDSES